MSWTIRLSMSDHTGKAILSEFAALQLLRTTIVQSVLPCGPIPQITTRSWDDKESGKKIYRTEIVVGNISLLSDNGRGGKVATEQGPGRHEQSEEAAGDFDELGISDQDIPF